MESRLTVYEKPTCTTCRKLFDLLVSEGVDFDRVDYYVEPMTRELLESILAKSGLEPRDLLRKRAPQYETLGLDDPAVPRDRIIDALVEYPDLVQRPIVVRGDRAVLARPVENVRALLRD